MREKQDLASNHLKRPNGIGGISDHNSRPPPPTAHTMTTLSDHRGMIDRETRGFPGWLECSHVPTFPRIGLYGNVQGSRSTLPVHLSQLIP